MIAIGFVIVLIVAFLHTFTDGFWNWSDGAQNIVAILFLIGVSLLGTGLFLFAWRYLP